MNLTDLIESQREPMIARLQELVHIESPSGGQPGLDAMMQTLSARHEQLGGQVSVISAEPTNHLLVSYAPDDATPAVLLVGHADTVWDLGTLSTTVPWRREGDTIAGPGAFDMKSGLVIMETALWALQQAGLEHRPVRIIITSDEEVGSASSSPVIAKLAPTTELALGFESPHPDGAFKIGRRGSTRLQIEVIGKEAHAALDPDSGISAIDELVDQLVAVRTIIDHVSTQFPGAVLCNVGAISGGARANVIPGEAKALIGLRFTSADVEKLTLEALQALKPIRKGAQLTTRILTSRPTWQAHAADHEALSQLELAAAAAGLTIAGRPAAGAADTNLLGSLGVPTIDGLGPTGGGAHAVTEHISIDSFVERAILLANFLAKK